MKFMMKYLQVMTGCFVVASLLGAMPAQAQQNGTVRPAKNNLTFMETAPKRDISGEKALMEQELRDALATGPRSKKGPKRFDDCDKSNQGYLSSMAFRLCFKRAGALFRTIDADRDSKVTKDEIAQYLAAPQGATGGTKIRRSPEERRAAVKSRLNQQGQKKTVPNQ